MKIQARWWTKRRQGKRRVWEVRYLNWCFKNILIAKGRPEKTLAFYLKRMVISQTGTQSRDIKFFLCLSHQHWWQAQGVLKQQDHDCKNDKHPVNPQVVGFAAPAGSLWVYGAWLDSSQGTWRPGWVIARPLSMIFEQFLESGKVPVDWKLANVVTVFKKGKKFEPGNCRPVSLTSVPCKIIQKIILGRIEKHLEDDTAISQSQHTV